MKRRYLVLIVVAIVFPTAGLIALYLIEDWRGARAWESLSLELAARGESLDVAAFIPPPIPDDRNLALAPVLVRSLNGKPPSASGTFKSWEDMPATRYSERPRVGRDNWTAGRLLPLAKWQQFYAKSKEQPHPDKPGAPAGDVLIALAEFAPLLDEVVREAEVRPQSRLPIDWKQKPAAFIWIPQSSLYLRLTETLCLRASAELAEGRHDAASRDTAAALRLCRSLGQLPLMSGFLMDYSGSWMAVQPVWEGLAARRWTPDELKGFQALLRQDDHLANYLRATRGERACFCSTLDSMRESAGNGEAFFSGGSGKPTSPVPDILAEAITVMPRGWISQNKAVVCRLYQGYIDAVDPRMHKISLARLAVVEADVRALSKRPYLVYTLVARMVGNWTTSLIQRAARMQTTFDQAGVACALERYYLDRQTYPETLDTLVPAYLDRVPTDVIDGAPMRYRCSGDGRYLLYGIGWDGRDDGGTVAWRDGTSERYPARPDDKASDWVWQYTPMDPPVGMW